jgi:hypothetical protein
VGERANSKVFPVAVYVGISPRNVRHLETTKIHSLPFIFALKGARWSTKRRKIKSRMSRRHYSSVAPIPYVRYLIVALAEFIQVLQTVSAMTTLFYVMTMNPHVLKKAQAELDAVIGTDRLPQMSDLGALPYINAVIKEILRWSPPVPLGEEVYTFWLLGSSLWSGLRHRVTDDDIYGDFFIPKGSILVSNIWCVFISLTCHHS